MQADDRRRTAASPDGLRPQAAHRQRGLPDRKRSAVCPAHAACPAGGAMLLTGAAGPFSPETAAGVVQECRRRRYGTVIVPFPAAELTEALAQPLHRSGIALWVHEMRPRLPARGYWYAPPCPAGISKTGCPPAAVPSGRTVSCWTSSACGWTSLSPVPLVRGIPLTDEQLAALQTGRQIFFFSGARRPVFHVPPGWRGHGSSCWTTVTPCIEKSL